MKRTASAGRFCPVDYRYQPAAFARRPDLEADTVYVVGGVYGNALALDAVEQMARREHGKVEVVYNGDFHWLDIDAHGFSALQTRVLASRATRGNVETEISREGGDADIGCGCGYPDSIADEDVQRSNEILFKLRQTAVEAVGCRDQLAALPTNLVIQVGGCRVGVVHGDAESLAGWRFAFEALDDERNFSWFHHVRSESNVSIFASSHTGLPAMREFTFDGAQLVIANNGAAGLPNFFGKAFGVLTRISVLPPGEHRLYGTRLADTYVDALAIEYDNAKWQCAFESNWPPGSPAHTSYYSRIVKGPPFHIQSAMPRGRSAA